MNLKKNLEHKTTGRKERLKAYKVKCCKKCDSNQNQRLKTQKERASNT